MKNLLNNSAGGQAHHSPRENSAGAAPLPYDPALTGRPVLIQNHLSFAQITQVVVGSIFAPTPKWWFISWGMALVVLNIFGFCLYYLLFYAIGVWGLSHPVMWGYAIVNLVFWVGIGHAGTLISAVLFLFRQKWRTGINRFAEAMTIFAVICALQFPLFHTGRPWLAAYWMLPIPNSMAMWPNWRSPLLMDLFAFSTYFLISLLFWFVGLIPDLATMRDQAKNKWAKLAYGIFALGWRSSARHWVHYERAYLLLAAIATPLVLSVHSIVAFDFAVSQLPGWHTTIFPPYFVAGAVFSGFGMVITLLVPARKLYGLESLVTPHHLDNICRIILATGSLVGYAYILEFFIAWYSGNDYEKYVFINRAFGPYWWAYWTMFSCNVICPQLFWFRTFRTNTVYMWIVSIFVNIGMWFERFVITVTSLHRDFMPANWDYYSPSWVDALTFFGSFGLFFTFFLLFLRCLPAIAIAEVKSIAPQAHIPLGDAH